jgi:hypothetical protein
MAIFVKTKICMDFPLFSTTSAQNPVSFLLDMDACPQCHIYRTHFPSRLSIFPPPTYPLFKPA